MGNIQLEESSKNIIDCEEKIKLREELLKIYKQIETKNESKINDIDDDDEMKLTEEVTDINEYNVNHNKDNELNELQLNKKKRNSELKGRMDFMNKLLNTNAWNTKNTYEFQYVCVFDWDELFDCTSYILKNKLDQKNYELDLNQSQIFAKLELQILRLLTQAQEKTNVIIISKKNEQWINFCIDKFYPSLSVIKDKIQFLYLPAKINEKSTNDCANKTYWILKLSEIKELTDDNIIWNISFFGYVSIDKDTFKNRPNIIFKNIKVIGVDNTDHLLNELIMLNNELYKIINTPNNITMKINKKKR